MTSRRTIGLSMFEKFTSLGSADFKQRYIGTYGFFKEGEKKTLVQIMSINRDGVHFIDRNKSTYYLKPDSDSDVGFEFIPPKSSYYNIAGGDPVLITRLPARQYSRGVCDKNTRIKGLNLGAQEVGFPSLAAIFESKETVQSALSAGCKQGLGFAVSPQFAVSFKSKSLLCFDHSIGSVEYDRDLFKINLDQPDVWGTEIRDAFARNNLKVELV